MLSYINNSKPKDRNINKITITHKPTLTLTLHNHNLNHNVITQQPQESEQLHDLPRQTPRLRRNRQGIPLILHNQPITGLRSQNNKQTSKYF